MVQTMVTIAPCAEGILFLVQKADIGSPGGMMGGPAGLGGAGGVTTAGINFTVTLNCDEVDDDAGPAKH